MSIRVSIDDGVAVVALARPERRNALGPGEAARLAAELDALRDRPDVRAVILTGDGAFSAGGDLPAIVELVRQGPQAVADRLYDSFHAMIRALVGQTVPTLAAVDGPAVGLGFDLALGCDTIFVGSKGWLRQGWGQMGLIPGTGGELLLRHRNPTLLWTLLCDDTKLSGAAAEAGGIAVAVPEAIAHARTFAAGLARLPRATLAAYVELRRAELRAQLTEHLAGCLRLQVQLLCSDEFLSRAESTLERFS